ncbi:MAG: PD-(D/E)XK nuclease family protein [Candidatus Gastranaerophilaceae bacterium]
MIISPAMLKTFEECPKKYEFLYLNKISLPKNKYLFEKGKNIHSIANYFIKGFDIKKLENVLTSQEIPLWNYLKSTAYFKYDLLQSEYSLSIKLDDYWIGGRLDALVKNNEDYYVLDYKTGAIPKNPEYDYQTMIYLLCVDKLIKNYDSLTFVYLDLKNKTESSVKLNEILKKAYKEKILSVLQKISYIESNNKILRNNKCKCDYYCICQ